MRLRQDVEVLAQLGVGIEADPDAARAPVHPALCAGPGVLRGGVLAVLADCASGVQVLRELEGVTPVTTGLSVHSTGEPARSEAVVATSRMLRLHRGGAVLEVEVREDAPGGRRLALSTITYRCPLSEGARYRLAPAPDGEAWLAPGGGAPLAEVVGVRAAGPAALEVDLPAGVRNGVGILNGGVASLLIDLVAEQGGARALGSDVAVTDLVIDFLAAARVGPVRASAEVLACDDRSATVRVEVADTGAGDRLVAVATAIAIGRGPAS